ncbi:MAG: response regulator [Prochloraceae cyanobacterium]
MIFLSEREFTNQVKKTNNDSQVFFENKILARGPVFSKKLRNKAIDFGKKYLENGIFCLLVENEWSLTIWIDKENNIHLQATPIQKVVASQEKIARKPIVACIDDSKTIQLQVKKTLEIAGYRVLSITDPVLGMTTLAKYKPELILMDINMPNFNGYELCKMLHKSRQLKDIPIAMFSSQNGIIDRIRAKMSGTIGFLNKPISGFELIDFVSCIVPIRSESISVISERK